MKAYIVDQTNLHEYPGWMDQFYIERHRVYADELKWVEPSPDGRERDAFDTPAATYFLFVEGDRVIGGSRLVPTHLPHLVSEVFPNIFTKAPIVRDPCVAEWTRGFLAKDIREGAGLLTKAQCCAAVMEYCLEQGYRQIGGIQDAKWLAIWKRMGWSVHVHGDPIDIGGEAWLPAYFDVTEEALAGARKWGKLDGPIIANRVGRPLAA
jgi:acyl-homoserine lactone synthase